MSFTNTSYLGTGKYSAREDRFAAMGQLIEGVAPVQGGDPQTALLVRPRGSGANLSVDIAPGLAYVAGDDVLNQGVYLDYNDATVNLPIPAPGPPTQNPRVDAIVARVIDTELSAAVDGPGDRLFFQWIPGTPIAGVTIDNPGASAPSLPASSLLLAYVYVAANTTSIGSGDISDQRRLVGPAIFGEDGNRYRLAINADGALVVEPR